MRITKCKPKGLPGLQSLREKSGMDRYALADLVGVRYSTIHKLETAGANCSITLLQALCEKLSVPAEALFESKK